jgi:hypothetical protein
MSGGANKAFVSNPVNWMRNNVLLIDIQTNTSVPSATGGPVAKSVVKYPQGAVVSVNIDKDASLTAKVAGGGSRPVFRVKEATGAAGSYSHRFNAYYLPFFSNDFRVMTLDPAQFPPGADFFFTDTVNGCSFAAGSGATPKVGHFNRTVDARDPGSAIDQGAMNADIGLQFGGGTTVKLTKATYKPGTPDYASVFGIRNNAGWTFYWQGPRSWIGIKNGEKEWQVPANMLNQCDNNG